MEIAPSHLDDRAEAAVERATAGRLHDVYLPADHGVARDNASIPIGTPDLTAFQTCHGPVGVVEKATIAAIGQTRKVISPSPRIRKSGASRTPVYASGARLGS